MELDAVRRHLRGFLIVHDPDGKPLYFRYYDPRVLRVFLSTCNAAELQEMFGPLSWYAVEAETPENLLLFQVKEGNLAVKTIALPGPEED
jgi:hypothetical protein